MSLIAKSWIYEKNYSRETFTCSENAKKNTATMHCRQKIFRVHRTLKFFLKNVGQFFG